VIGFQDYWRQLSANSSIVACRTANPTSFLRPVVSSASLLSATAIFWRLAIPLVADQTDKQTSTRSMLLSAQGAHVSHAVHPAPVQPARWPHPKYSPRWVGRPPHFTGASGTRVERPGPRANSPADSVPVPHLIATTGYLASLCVFGRQLPTPGTKLLCSQSR